MASDHVQRCGQRLPDADWLAQIAQCIDTHHSEPLTLDRLAEMCHGSPYHLHRTFKRIKGITPVEYVQQTRISKAIAYLAASDAWVMSRFPNSILVQDDDKLQPYTAELVEYLQGKRQRFTIPFDVHGTSFQMAVWIALCEIPYGQTQSYSDIANHLQNPAAVRAVGAAIAANPVLITVPCHRVIGKNGALTGYRGGLDMKKQLLQLESESPFM